MKRSAEENDVKWVKALRKELATVRAKANRPRPKGVSKETWDGLRGPYKAEALLLRTLLDQLEKRP